MIKSIYLEDQSNNLILIFLPLNCSKIFVNLKLFLLHFLESNYSYLIRSIKKSIELNKLILSSRSEHKCQVEHTSTRRCSKGNVELKSRTGDSMEYTSSNENTPPDMLVQVIPPPCTKCMRV